MAQTLYLIDGHAQIFRAFYAVEGLTAPDGRPTGAAFGFTRMLNDALRKHAPDAVAAVFDAPGKTFRHEKFPDYKAQRKPTPPELIQQVPLIQDIVRAYRIPVFSLPGYEADDVIGTLARQAEAAGIDVVIVTGDKDCGQLLSARIRIWDAQKDLFTTVETFTEKKGIPPALLPDLMGLWGDASDNIPGVAGIGEKIGAELIRQFGSLDALLERAGEVKGKRGEKIRECADLARLSRDLATIRVDAPVTLDFDACLRKEPDVAALRRIFQDLDFKKFLHELDKDAPPGAGEVRDYVLVDTPEKFDAFRKALARETLFAFDTETTGLDPLQADLVGMSFSWAEKSAFYLPFRGPEGAAVLSEKELRQAAAILENPAVKKLGQNLKYDALVLRRLGITLQGIVFDTLLAAGIADGARENNLDALALRHLNLRKIPTEDLIGSGAKQITMDAVPMEKIRDYACEDADATWRLAAVLGKKLDERSERPLLETLELPLSLVLTEMQWTGIRVDTALLESQSRELAALLETLTAEIHSLAGKEFNIASPKQLAAILFDEMKLPVIRRLKTGPSTDEDTLRELAAQGHELPSRLLDYRAYAKLKNTYLDALPLLVNPATGRIHTTFTQTATATGRLSSRDPNLQNIPVRTEKGRAIRAAFVPEPGWKLLAADYSQVELRILAHFAGDEALRRAFAEGRDIHRVVASEVNGIPEEEVTREQRAAAKAINFGIIYGQSAHGLAQATDMSRPQAQLFIDSYFERFPRVKSWIDDSIFQATDDGGVRTILGRRRELPDLASANRMTRARAEREAVNTIVQGSAADLVKTAMVNLAARMKDETPRSRMLLQIHDELVFETPPEEVETLRRSVKEEMESALPLSVPLAVDLGVGDNWLEVK